MKRRIVSLLTAVLVAVTVFAVPVNSFAAQTGTTAAQTKPAATQQKAQAVQKKSIAKANVTISQKAYEFTKKPVKPIVTVKLAGKKLVKGTDYTVTYYNNTYPGTAKIVVKGKGKYKGTKSKTFAIAQVKGLIYNYSNKTEVKLNWNTRKNVTGYCVYKYDPSAGKYKWIKNTTASEAVIKNLKPGLGYQFRVKAYYKKSGKVYYSPFSSTISVPTTPEKVTIKSVINHPSLYVNVSWKKQNATGYEVMLSRNSKFKDAPIYKVTSNKVNSRTIKNLYDGSKYYIKVRAYKTYANKTKYGAWSSVKTFTTDGTRWYEYDGNKYYYSKGKRAYGHWTIGGHGYYFDKETGAYRGPSEKMWEKVHDQYSKTPYLLAVSRELNVLYVYVKNSNGEWVVKDNWDVSTGRPTSTSISKTPTGSWLMPEEETHLGYIGGHKDYTCWYATRFYNRCFFHSVIYNPASKSSIQDGRLGMNISDGCIRMDINNAKWIYDNCHGGTRVVVY